MLTICVTSVTTPPREGRLAMKILIFYTTTLMLLSLAVHRFAIMD
jgi:hypothetical protein